MITNFLSCALSVLTNVFLAPLSFTTICKVNREVKGFSRLIWLSQLIDHPENYLIRTVVLETNFLMLAFSLMICFRLI